MNNFKDKFLCTDKLGRAFIYQFDSDYQHHSIKDFVGFGFSAYENVFTANVTNDTVPDLVVKMTCNQYLLIKPDINKKYINSEVVRLDQKLSDYVVIRQGIVSSDRKHFIGQKTNNDICTFSIDVGTGLITENILVAANEQYKDIVLGHFKYSSRHCMLGYTETGNAYYHEYDGNNSLQSGNLLGNWPNHTFYGTADFINKGFDDIVSHNNENIMLWRFNTGVLLNGMPTVRSGNSPNVYAKLIPVNFNGSIFLCSFKLTSDIWLLEFTSSFRDSVYVGSINAESIIAYS